MPVYEYACQKCNHHFDVRHSVGESPTLCCPECNGEVKKVFRPAGIIFKGTGWHITDYAPKSRALEEKADRPEEKAEKPEEKAEKPEEKADKKESAPAASSE